MEIENLSLEDRIYFYLQEIYNVLNEIYKYAKNNEDDEVYHVRYLKTRHDGFESAIVYLDDNMYFEAADWYANKLHFNYMDEYGKIVLPPSLDGLFYASQVTLYEQEKENYRKKIKSEVGVKDMLTDDIVKYIENVYFKLEKYKTINLENSKVKVK